MKKIITALCLAASVGFAASNGIALTVNEDPITVFDIENRMQTMQVSKDKAASSLINDVLYEQELVKQNITVDIFDVNNHLEKLAAQNGMDLYTFKSIVRQKYKDYDRFEQQTKEQIKKEKLTAKLVRGNVKVATQEDLERYYENNQNAFQTADIINVLEFTSKSKAALISTQKNPMSALEGVNKQQLQLKFNQLNPQLKYIVTQTPAQRFTPIFTANKQFVMFYIAQKQGVTTIPFAEAKQRIFTVLMKQREDFFLKDYFEKLKLNADIKIIR